MKYPAKTLLIASLFAIALPLQAQALSINCEADGAADAPFNESDAVIAATVNSIETSATEGPRYDIAQITTYKYWKLQNNLIPKEIHAPSGRLRIGSYIMFLEYSSQEKAYTTQICSPLIEIQQQRSLNMDQIYYLKNQPLHNVRE